MNSNKIIAMLNAILANELVSINQYFLHSRMFGDWGFTKLESKEYAESIEEMKHADNLVKRILFLKGLPNLQNLGALNIGQTPKEIFQSDLAVEKEAIAQLVPAIRYCEQEGDFISRDLLLKILADEEQHIDWLETQLQLIGSLGIENYLQSQI